MLEIEGQIFDWDIDKNLLNIEKHGVPFKEAATVLVTMPPSSLMTQGTS